MILVQSLKALAMKTMLNFFSPGVEKCEAQESMYQNFLNIRDQEEPNRNKLISDPPDTVAYADAKFAEKTSTLTHVAEWVERWKRGHLGRLRFFADLPLTRYFILLRV
jgi:hypothetical protein